MKTSFGTDYEIDDSRDRLDFDLMEQWLSTTYWSPGIRKAEIIKGTENSAIAVGCYRGGKQVGFLRVASDKTRFGFFMDVYVDEPHRKKGIAGAMVEFVFQHPEFKDVYMWMLGTKDAHAVYAKVGFEPLPEPENWMWIRKPRPA